MGKLKLIHAKRGNWKQFLKPWINSIFRGTQTFDETKFTIQSDFGHHYIQISYLSIFDGNIEDYHGSNG